eukprot:jgi/Galph1/5059/GphlegSOOS_G3776.1
MFCIQVEKAQSSDDYESLESVGVVNSDEVDKKVWSLWESSDHPQETTALPERVEFSAGNPHLETITGELHLFRLMDKDVTEQSALLCVLAVPAYFTAADLCTFVVPVQNHILNMRILRDSRACNRYMVLIRFNSIDSAKAFYQEYEGKPFSSIGPECCRILAVSKTLFLNKTNNEQEEAFPDLQRTLELPTCPVCLERLDASISGLITSLCNHTMHCNCLSKWGDNSCPVCRYCQEPVPESNVCLRCGTTQSLWMCLICGHVGCGRYVEFHALVHFKESNHTFAMELESGRVWDYAGDNYVHRLIVNKTDGKLVELPSLQDTVETIPNGASSSSSSTAQCPSQTSKPPLEKETNEALDSILKEYDYLLTSQLESQREYYEQQIQQVEEAKKRETMQLHSQLRALKEEKEQLEKRYKQLEKEKKTFQHKVNEMEKNRNKWTEENAFLKSLNETLLRNQSEWKEKYNILSNQLEQEKQKQKELEDELRDLRFHLSTAHMLSEEEKHYDASPDALKKNQSTEWKGGDVIGVASAPSTRSSSRRKDKAKLHPNNKK